MTGDEIAATDFSNMHAADNVAPDSGTTNSEDLCRNRLAYDSATKAERWAGAGFGPARRPAAVKRRNPRRLFDLRGRFGTDQGDRSPATARGITEPPGERAGAPHQADDCVE